MLQELVTSCLWISSWLSARMTKVAGMVSWRQLIAMLLNWSLHHSSNYCALLLAACKNKEFFSCCQIISTTAHLGSFLHLIFVTYTKVFSSRTYKVLIYRIKTYVFVIYTMAKHSSHIYTTNIGQQSERNMGSPSASHCKCHYSEGKKLPTLSFLQKHAQSFAGMS